MIRGKEYVLGQNIPYVAFKITKVACIMLATMSPEFQKSFKSLGAFNEHLKEIFQEQARQQWFEIMKSLMACKNQDGNFLSVHI